MIDWIKRCLILFVCLIVNIVAVNIVYAEGVVYTPIRGYSNYFKMQATMSDYRNKMANNNNQQQQNNVSRPVCVPVYRSVQVTNFNKVRPNSPNPYFNRSNANPYFNR